MTPDEKAMTAFPFTKGTNQINQMPEQMEMYVILVGNPRDGFRAIGPFKTLATMQMSISTPNRKMLTG